MKYIHVIFSALLLFVTVSGCDNSPNTPEEAVAFLNSMGIKFTPDALVESAKAGNKKAVHAFMIAGMNLYESNTKGETALIGAVDAQNAEMVKYILKKTDMHTDMLLTIDKQDKNANTALIVATEKGNLPIVELLLKNHANPNIWNKNFNQPTHIALKEGYRNIFNVLINSTRIDINVKNGKYQTILMQAVLQNEKDIVSKILEKDADVNIASHGNFTPLMAACKNKNIDIANLLIAKGAKIDAIDIQGRTPLNLAVLNNSGDIVNMLIEKGADINFTKLGFKSPLQVALENNTDNNNIIVALIANGADLKAVYDNANVLDQAIKKGSIEIVQLIVETTGLDNLGDSRETPITFAIKEQHEDIALYLIKNIKNPIKPNGFGETPLELAVEAEYTDVVNILIDKGADVNRRVKSSGYRLIDLAIKKGNADIVDALLSGGAEGKLNRMLVISVVEGRSDLMPILLRHGASPNTYRSGEPLIVYATSKGMKEAVSHLIDAKANLVLTRMGDEKTALTIASIGGKLDLMKLLLLNKAKIEAKDRYGMTALMHAAERRKFAAVKLLIKYGANVNSEDNYGRTPRDICAESAYGSIRDQKKIDKLLAEKGGVFNKRSNE